MPLYEFHCDQCDEQFEELLGGLHEADEVTCPSCGHTKVERLISGFAFGGGGGSSSLLSSSGGGGCSSSGGFS